MTVMILEYRKTFGLQERHMSHIEAYQCYAPIQPCTHYFDICKSSRNDSVYKRSQPSTKYFVKYEMPKKELFKSICFIEGELTRSGYLKLLASRIMRPEIKDIIDRILYAVDTKSAPDFTEFYEYVSIFKWWDSELQIRFKTPTMQIEKEYFLMIVPEKRVMPVLNYLWDNSPFVQSVPYEA